MKQKNNFHIFLAIAFLAFLGCSETEESIEVPEIEAKIVGKGRDLIGIPYLLISVTNIGRTEANIVHVHAYAQKNGNIVDAFKTTVWYLRPDETEVIRVKFLNLYSHSAYESIEINTRVVTF